MNSNKKIVPKRRLNIALVCVMNKNKKYAMNKDLNGGFGTADYFGNPIFSRMIMFIKKRSVRLPIISFAFLQAILNQQGHNVKYFEDKLPEKNFDLILIYGSIVDYKNENNVCRLLKKRFPKSKIGFFGPFPSINAEFFKSGDFVISGEPEYFFMNEFRGLNQLRGKIHVPSLIDMDTLPSPCFDGFPIAKYNYSPVIPKKPFLVLQSSRGCPYSCRFYCVYGEYQGSKLRLRSPQKVVEDIISIQKRYSVKSIQFRDPTFGLSSEFISKFCEELKKRDIKIRWGIETRPDLLNLKNLKQMFDAGLRNVNIGIETSSDYIAKKNKRKLVEKKHQERIIAFCEKLGIKVSAFYVLGYEGDTEETIKETIRYAIRLNTPLARFAISTPYPGTGFYNQLDKEGRILTRDYEKYTQFNLVYKHKNLSPKRMKQLLEDAYMRYYFRSSYFIKMLKWKIREFWL